MKARRDGAKRILINLTVHNTVTPTAHRRLHSLQQCHGLGNSPRSNGSLLLLRRDARESVVTDHGRYLRTYITYSER